MRKIFLFILVVCLFPHTTIGIEFDRGTALRQNLLLMRVPSGITRETFGQSAFGISETRLRLWGRAFFDNATVNAALDSRANLTSLQIPTADEEEGASILGRGIPLELFDLTFNHATESGTLIQTRIDRLDIYLSIGDIDLNIGRQPITLGTSHFVSVLDIIAPFAPGDLDATYKPGVDAVRIRRGIGFAGEAELIAVGADNMREGAYIGRLRIPYRGIDYEGMFGSFRRRIFGGVGWEGGFDDFGVWGEAALFERLDEPVRGGWSEAAFRAVAGLDYYISPSFMIGGALMYNDFGARSAEDLPTVLTDRPYAEGWVFLASAGYAVLTVNREMHPLVQAGASGLVNLVDASTLWQPQVTINVGTNTDLSIYGWVALGRGARDEMGVPVPRSEFGDMPSGGGFYARWFY